MTKQILILILIICIVSCKKENETAELGEQTPDYTFKNILNSEEEEISIRDLKGKVVILEFWATWCSPCIPAMQKLDSLQTEFTNDLEIITISSENTERLEKFIKSTNTNLRIVSDTLHRSNFRYKIIPHSIIIDKNGIVRAITSPENITKEVLNDLISKNEMSLDLKDDFYIDPTLEVKTIKVVSNSDYRIELKGYDQEKRGGAQVSRDIDGNLNGIEIWNAPIPRLYQRLFDIASPSRMIFKDGLSYDIDFPYEKEHQYNLIIETSQGQAKNWKEIGVDFLNDNFEFNAKKTIDTLDCFVLKTLDDRSIEKSNSGESSYMDMGPIFKGKRIKISRLVTYLEYNKALPIVDKTNLTEEYDIELNWQEEAPETLNAELKKYGLILERSNKKLPVEIMEIYRKE